jgi:hypothetical protein
MFLWGLGGGVGGSSPGAYAADQAPPDANGVTMGIYLTLLYARHRPVRLAADPAYSQLSQERRRLESLIAAERLSFGEATGHLVRLENQLAALIAYGKSMFHREAAKRQDQSEKRRVILDQLSDHLRNHLETIEPSNRLAAASVAGAANGRGNVMATMILRHENELRGTQATACSAPSGCTRKGQAHSMGGFRVYWSYAADPLSDTACQGGRLAAARPSKDSPAPGRHSAPTSSASPHS